MTSRQTCRIVTPKLPDISHVTYQSYFDNYECYESCWRHLIRFIWRWPKIVSSRTIDQNWSGDIFLRNAPFGLRRPQDPVFRAPTRAWGGGVPEQIVFYNLPGVDLVLRAKFEHWRSNSVAAYGEQTHTHTHTHAHSHLCYIDKNSDLLNASFKSPNDMVSKARTLSIVPYMS